MRKLLLFLFVLFAFKSYGQNPAGLPQNFYYKWYQYAQYLGCDSGFLLPTRDTIFKPTDPVMVLKDSFLYYHSNGKWRLPIADKLRVPFTLGDGTGTPYVSSDSSYNFSRTFNPARASNAHGMTLADVFNRNSNGFAYAGYDMRSVIAGTSDYNHFAPFQNAARYQTTGTTAYAYGFIDVPTITAGTIANRVGIKINDVAVVGGTVVNNYGLLINAFTSGTNLNYGILSNADVKFTAKIYLNALAISDTPAISELKAGAWVQAYAAGSSYLMAAANAASTTGIGYYRSFGAQSGYRCAVCITSTNASTTVPLLRIMQRAGQVVIGDSVVNTNIAAKLVVNGSAIVKDTAFFSGLVAVGTILPHSSAVVDVTSTTKGFLMPRMATTSIDAIPTPAEGLIVYDTTVHKFRAYNGTTWKYFSFE